MLELPVKVSKDCNSSIAAKTITANPAAGPLTPKADPLRRATITPPIIPATSPENKGAPDAKEIPKHSGIATSVTTIPAGKSYLRFLKKP